MKLTLPHYLFPIICLLAGIACQYSGLDVSLESFFYDFKLHQWPYKETWLTQTLIHKGGRDIVSLSVIGMLLMLPLSFINYRLARYRRNVSFLLVSSLTGMLIVSLLKNRTHLYTPWDLNIFGGHYPNIRLFDTVANYLPVGHAFPAGHASAGFAFLGFYFLARNHLHRRSVLILYITLGMGIIFGIDQQIRGAHMLSHDLFSLAICWTSCLIWSALLLPVSNSNDAITREKELSESLIIPGTV